VKPETSPLAADRTEADALEAGIRPQSLADFTGQPIDRIARDTDRDFFLRPSQAVEYGIVDQIVARKG